MTITLGAYRALPTCKRCNVPVIPYYDLTPEHQMLGVRALGSNTSGICAPCWTASNTAGVDPDYIPARERTPFGQFQLRQSHLTTSKPGEKKFQTPERRYTRTELPPALPPTPAPRPEPTRVQKPPPEPVFRPFIRGDWVDDALCAQTDPEAFFPEAGDNVNPALRICQACPVRQKCLDWALANNETFGVWGGTTPNDRRKLRRARGAA